MEPNTEPKNVDPAAIPPPGSSATPPTTGAAAAAAPPGDAPAKPKRRGWKVFKWSVVLLLLVLVVGGVIVYLNLNGIIERTFEKQATASTNLRTELGAARLSLFGGTLGLDRLEVASPAGFAAPHMLTLGDADVRVSIGQLRGDPVRIASVTLDKPKLVVERAASGELNFKVASDLMPKTDPAPDPNAEPLKLIIDDLTIRDASVVVRPGIAGLAEEFTVIVPTVNMKQIGSGEGAQNGAAVKDVLMQVVTVLAARASSSGQLPAELQKLMNANLGEVMGQLGQEAQARIAEAVPGPLGAALGDLAKDPNALLKDPGAAIEKQLGGQLDKLIGGKKPGEGTTTAPADEPPAAEKAIEEGLKGLLNRDKEREKDKRKQPREERR